MQRNLKREIALHAAGASLALLRHAGTATDVTKQKVVFAANPGPGRNRAKSKTSSSGVVLHNIPVAHGYTTSGPSFSFSAVKAGGLTGMKIRGSQIYCTVFGETGTTSVLVPYGAATSAAVSNLNFDPNNNKLMPPPLTNFGQSFNRFRLNAVTFEYLPAVATGNAGQLAFAWSSDAYTSMLAGYSYTNLQQLGCSVAGPIWQHMVLKCPCDGEIRYMANSTTSSALTPAEERLDCPGALLGSCNGVNGGGPVLYGTVRAHYDIDFFEVSTVSVESSRLKLERDLTRKILQELPPCCDHKFESHREKLEVKEPDSPVLVLASNLTPQQSTSSVVSKDAREVLRDLRGPKLTNLSGLLSR